MRDQPTQHMMARVECDDSTPETAALTGDAAELGADQNTQVRKVAFSAARVQRSIHKPQISFLWLLSIFNLSIMLKRNSKMNTLELTDAI